MFSFSGVRYKMYSIMMHEIVGKFLLLKKCMKNIVFDFLFSLKIEKNYSQRFHKIYMVIKVI